MTDKYQEQTALTKQEREMVTFIAARDGISEDEAASNLVKAALARRTRKRGKGPSRVLQLRNGGSK